jgi:hypothetical protein
VLADLKQRVLVLFLLLHLLVAQSMQNARQLLFLLFASLEQVAQGLILILLLFSCEIVNMRHLCMQLSQQTIAFSIIHILALKSLLVCLKQFDH